MTETQTQRTTTDGNVTCTRPSGPIVRRVRPSPYTRQSQPTLRRPPVSVHPVTNIFRECRGRVAEPSTITNNSLTYLLTYYLLYDYVLLSMKFWEIPNDI